MDSFKKIHMPVEDDLMGQGKLFIPLKLKKMKDVKMLCFMLVYRSSLVNQ